MEEEKEELSIEERAIKAADEIDAEENGSEESSDDAETEEADEANEEEADDDDSEDRDDQDDDDADEADGKDVPYNRFKEINEKRKKAEGELKAWGQTGLKPEHALELMKRLATLGKGLEKIPALDAAFKDLANGQDVDVKSLVEALADSSPKKKEESSSKETERDSELKERLEKLEFERDVTRLKERYRKEREKLAKEIKKDYPGVSFDDDFLDEVDETIAPYLRGLKSSDDAPSLYETGIKIAKRHQKHADRLLGKQVEKAPKRKKAGLVSGNGPAGKRKSGLPNDPNDPNWFNQMADYAESLDVD